MKSHDIKADDRFGKWTVIGQAYRRKLGEGRGANYPLYYPCRCDCGTERGVRAFKLLGNSTSCGCDSKRLQIASKTIHGENQTLGRRTRLYRIWSGMQQRCHNPNHPTYEGYGAAGITVCTEWRESFVAFRDWANINGYREDLTIDRKRNEDGYHAENCRWSTTGEQSRNKRTNRMVTIGDETRCVEDWARDERCSVAPASILHRINKLAMTPEDAVFTPRMTRKSSGPYQGSHGQLRSSGEG